MLSVQLNNISKKYHIEYRRRLSIKDSLLDFFQCNQRKNEFWALRNISLEVKEGEILGIIGQNGSGKTTLLRLLCGITKPTQGYIKTKGQVAGVLELGAGFQDNLTGRENIFINGLIMGLSKKEIKRKIDSIIDFADIGDFIDAPVRTYSAGMYLRLGFAISVQINSDILLIDEVLAVGDEAFQEKCLVKIKELKNQHKTIIFASHNLNMIEKHCERAILMNKSKIIFEGRPEAVINRYVDIINRQRIT